MDFFKSKGGFCMFKVFLKRGLYVVPQAVLFSAIMFFLASSMVRSPFMGNPYFLHNAPTSFLARVRRFFEVSEDYLYWFGNFVRGDLGRSFQGMEPVMNVIGRRLPNTLFLSIIALVIMYGLAIPLAVFGAKNSGTLRERILAGISYVGFAIPMFTFTLLMMYVFAFRLGWFPSGGSRPPGATPYMEGYFWYRFHHLILPALCIALVAMIPIFHYLKTEMLQVSLRPFATTVRAKGGSEYRVYGKHVFRNSLFPVTSNFGLQVATLLGGTIFVESLFSIPGLGVLFITSVEFGDLNVVAGLVMLYALITMIGSCLSDMMTALADPRVRIK